MKWILRVVLPAAMVASWSLYAININRLRRHLKDDDQVGPTVETLIHSPSAFEREGEPFRRRTVLWAYVTLTLILLTVLVW